MNKIVKVIGALAVATGGVLGASWLLNKSKVNQLSDPNAPNAALAQHKKELAFMQELSKQMQLTWTEAYNLIWLKTFILFVKTYDKESTLRGKPILSHPMYNIQGDALAVANMIGNFYDQQGTATQIGAKIGSMIGGPLGTIVGGVGGLVAGMFTALNDITVGAKYREMNEVEYPVQKMLADALRFVGPPPTELWHLAAKMNPYLYYNPFRFPSTIGRDLLNIYLSMGGMYGEELLKRVPTMGRSEMQGLRKKLRELGLADIQIAFDDDMWYYIEQRTARGKLMIPDYVGLHPGMVLKQWKFYKPFGNNPEVFYNAYIEQLKKKPMPRLGSGHGVIYHDLDLQELKVQFDMVDNSITIFTISPGTPSREVPPATLAELFFGTGTISTKLEDWSTLFTLPLITRDHKDRLVDNWFTTNTVMQLTVADTWTKGPTVASKHMTQSAPANTLIAAPVAQLKNPQVMTLQGNPFLAPDDDQW